MNVGSENSRFIHYSFLKKFYRFIIRCVKLIFSPLIERTY